MDMPYFMPKFVSKRLIKTFFIVFCRKGRYNVKMLCYALGQQWNRKNALFEGKT